MFKADITLVIDHIHYFLEMAVRFRWDTVVYKHNSYTELLNSPSTGTERPL